jgi:hypothetical protein
VVTGPVTAEIGCGRGDLSMAVTRNIIWVRDRWIDR